MRINLFICILLFSNVLCAQTIKSPQEFLGSNYGEQFTPHHRLVDYIKHVAENSDKVEIEQYGQTNEGRPLYLLYVSSAENLKNKENIRQSNLDLAGLSDNSTNIEEGKSIVWLSYSVHGNEAGGSESSMNVLYNLIQDNDQIKSWLNNVFVVIDPSLNPDGYSRYTNWFISNSGKFLHPEHSDVEHMEPWPGGRVNHYLFDLNRDWAWQTQVETQQRIAKYNQWMPHIHADLHEMGYDDHYYFAPAAEPYHDAISDWQKDFQFEIGKNHARYFDENGWLYFSREIFDLLYPSYGDSWPTFNGSIGMTYEQAGHGMSGRSIRMSNGKDLTLQDRIDHHTTTSLSTVEMASLNKDLILEEFQSYFKNSKEKPIGKYKYYVVKQGEQIHKFTELLLRNKIDFEFVNESKSLKAYSYSTSKEEMVQVEQGDILLNVFQPKSTLLQTLMEEAPILSDSLTYDITAWSLPFAFNLKCFAWLNKPLIETSDFTDTFFDSENIFGPYGLAFKWNSSGDSKIFLSNLLQSGVVVKSVQKEIKLDNLELNKGDFVILKADLRDGQDINAIIDNAESGLNVSGQPISSGFSTSGTDLGGSALQIITAPKVLTFFGDGVNANSLGQIWHYFEQIIHYPVSRVDISHLSGNVFSDFNTIILPDGYYSFSENQLKDIEDWVMHGGKLITIGGANRALSKSKNLAISSSDLARNSTENESDKERYKKRNYEGSERREISGSMPGAIIKTQIDNSHPLCYGINEYFTLKNSTMSIPLLDNEAYNPIRVPENYVSYGFIGSNIRKTFENSVVFSTENYGNGTVIYMIDNPLFRGFWKGGEIIFANALFQIN